MYDLTLIIVINLIIVLASVFFGVKINTNKNKKKCIACLTDMSMKLRDYREYKSFDVYDTWCGEKYEVK